MAVVGGPKPARHADIAAALAKAGISVESLSLDDLAAGTRLRADRFDALVLADSAYFPYAAKDSVLRFLRAGGDLVLLGGRAFEHAVWKVEGRWVTEAELQERAAAMPVLKRFFGFEDGTFGGWQRGTNNKQHKTTLASASGKVGRCLRIDIGRIGRGWDTQSTALPASFPKEANLLVFWAKASKGTAEMAVELDEGDGSRWIAVVRLGQEWRRYALTPRAFKFWKDSWSKGRGGSDDVLCMQKAARLSFGLATGHTRFLPGAHTLWIDEVGCGRMALPAGINFSKRLDLELFPATDVYRLECVESIVSTQKGRGDPAVSVDAEWRGQFGGWSAVGHPVPRKGRMIPLLSARDGHGRHRGWAASLLVHHAGDYCGSHWLLVGIDMPSFYHSDAFAPMLARLLKRMQGDSLAKWAAAQDASEEAHRLPLSTAAPKGFVRVSDDGRSLAKPDGEPLFLIGCNYIGTFDRKVWSGAYTVRTLADDFQAMAAAGLNSARVYGAAKLLEKPHLREALFECARRHGIYLLLELDADGWVEFKKATSDTIREHLRSVAAAAKDESMVLGYDLENEPYLGTIAAIRFDGQPSPVLKLQPYERFTGHFDRKWVDKAVKERPGWPKVPKWTTDDEARQLYTAAQIWNRHIRQYLGDGNASVFARHTGRLPLDGELHEFLAAVNETFGLWVRLAASTLRETDSNHLVSVGYNTILECLPANQPLDFVSHHVYERPFSYEHVRRNLTTLDRLAKTWPDRPITLGEFGYSNGIAMGERRLDEHSAAVGETMHYLWALSHGYSGCMKWALADWPVPYSRRFAPWLRDDEHRTYESGFGLYAYDGTPTGRPKPIVHALRFLREYVDAGGRGGKLHIRKGQALTIGAAYEYRAENALFIGDVSSNTSRLRFRSEKPTNLMLAWTASSLRMLSTCDLEVTIAPAQFASGLQGRHPRVQGKCAGVRQAERGLSIRLLAGQAVRIGD